MEKEESSFVYIARKLLLMSGVFAYVYAIASLMTMDQTISNGVNYERYLKGLPAFANRFDDKTYQQFQESYVFFEKTAETTKPELQKQTDKDKATVDSLKQALTALQQADKPIVPKRYRIKRIWQNSDTQPWTYNAYTSVYLRGGGRYFSSRLKMGGNAQYVGDNRLDYVNVVFSDNSFRQFKVKDSPEWILAKEGELVKRDSDKFVPLFKK